MLQVEQLAWCWDLGLALEVGVGVFSSQRVISFSTDAELNSACACVCVCVCAQSVHLLNYFSILRHLEVIPWYAVLTSLDFKAQQSVFTLFIWLTLFTLFKPGNNKRSKSSQHSGLCPPAWKGWLLWHPSDACWVQFHFFLNNKQVGLTSQASCTAEISILKCHRSILNCWSKSYYSLVRIWPDQSAEKEAVVMGVLSVNKREE